MEKFSGIPKWSIAMPPGPPHTWGKGGKEISPQQIRFLFGEPYPESRNKKWGFYGAIANADPNDLHRLLIEIGVPDENIQHIFKNLDALAEIFWQQEMHYLIGEMGLNPSEARDFLDGQMGRHWGNEILSGNPSKEYLKGEIKRWKRSYNPEDYEFGD